MKNKENYHSKFYSNSPSFKKVSTNVLNRERASTMLIACWRYVDVRRTSEGDVNALPQSQQQPDFWIRWLTFLILV